jgi:hypothetical protein
VNAPELTLNYVHTETMGYGRLGTKLAAALTEAGITVYDDMGEPPDWYQGNPERALNLAERTTAPSPTNVACWVSTPSHARWWYEGQHTTMFTMWETMRLPEAFREHLHEFETVIVPSKQNLELFSRYHPNVRYVPLGMSPNEWAYRERTPPDRYFRFLIGGSGLRKGTDIAFEAFRTVFPQAHRMHPQPTLVMKNPRNEPYYGDCVEIISGKLPAEAEQDLYGSAHCYLQPSRGEGFGLQPLQAIAQGCPTILTNAHGHEAFAHLGVPIGWTPEKAGYFIFGDAGDWWLPNFEELCEAMHDMYHNYSQHQAVALEASKRAHREFTWARTVEKLRGVWGDLLTTPYRGDGSHHRLEAKLYPLMVNQPHKCEIGPETFILKPGVMYYEHADVKRILFEAGLLDPACLSDEDNGLTEAQMARLGYYRAAHEYCPTCSQRLNTQPTKADAHEAGVL